MIHKIKDYEKYMVRTRDHSVKVIDYYDQNLNEIKKKYRNFLGK